MKKETLEQFMASLPYCGHCNYEHLEVIEVGAKWQQERMYSEEDLKEAFIEGYKQRAEKSNLIFDNASIMYAIHLFQQFIKK